MANNDTSKTLVDLSKLINKNNITTTEMYIQPPIKINNSIHFMCGGKEMLRLEPNGDIYVRGELAENDVDVAEGLRHFLRSHKYVV